MICLGILFVSSCYFIDMNLYIFFIVLSHSFIHTIFFFAVPYYEENRLDAARRDNKELNIFFEAPYSTKGNSGNQDSELANSSKWCTLWTNPTLGQNIFYCLMFTTNLIEHFLLNEASENSSTEKENVLHGFCRSIKTFFWNKLLKICSTNYNPEILPL